MRTLFLSCDPLEGAVTRYRCTGLAQALCMEGHSAETATIFDPVIRLEHDVVVLHRICANLEGQLLATAIRRTGAALIYGVDDLVFEAGPHRAMLQQADAVIVSTEALAQFAREAGAARTLVVRNTRKGENVMQCSFPEVLWKANKKDDSVTTTLFYPAGTATHDADFALIAPALRKVLERNPHVRLLVMGPVTIPTELQSLARPPVKLPRLPFEQYEAALSLADIVLAPLAPTRFNQGKSELKWLEAASWKKPTLASRWGGFAETVRDGEDGLLVESTAEWEQALELLIHNESRRTSLASAAFRRLSSDSRTAQRALLAELPLWRKSPEISGFTLPNPLGFGKGLAKSVLRRLQR